MNHLLSRTRTLPSYHLNNFISTENTATVSWHPKQHFYFSSNRAYQQVILFCQTAALVLWPRRTPSYAYTKSTVFEIRKVNLTCTMTSGRSVVGKGSSSNINFFTSHLKKNVLLLYSANNLIITATE